MVNLPGRIERPTATIAYSDSGGAGSAVVLTHGAGLDHSMWDAQRESLVSAGYRVVVWDLRGHGASTLSGGTRFAAADALDDLSALLDACGLSRAVLVGHSLGGNLAQAFVREHPERAVGLVVVDATWNTGPLTALERFGLRIAAPTLGLIPARSLPGLMARASAETERGVATATEAFARMPRRTFLDVWAATVSFVQPDPAYRSPVPLALLRGERDRTGNISSAMPRWAKAEGVAERVIPGAGHIVTWDAPEATSGALLAVLEAWRVAGS